MKYAGFLICFSLIAVFASPQNSSYIDSLKTTLLTAPNDTNKVESYFEIAYSYQWSKPDSALLYALPGLALARKLNFESGEFNLLLPVTEALSMKGNYSQALKFRFRSIELAYVIKDPTKIANALALTGNVYAYSKEYNKALEYYYRAKKTDAVSIGGPQILNGFIGQAYFHLHNWDSAFVYVKRAYDLERLATYRWSLPSQYLAAIYEQKGELAKAISLYRESLAISEVNNDKLKNYNGLASVFRKTGQTDSAIFYAKKAVSLGTNVSIPAPVIEASSILVDIYKSLHHTDSAFKYQEILLAFKDSLFSQEKIKQIQNVTFDEQLRQQELSNEKEKYRNKVKQFALVAALAVFVTIGFVLWRNNRTKQRANALLNMKNKEVENALNQLKSTQSQLVQSEKMASLGELTAGIAHEIQNPLNFVNNFSEVNNELIEELKSENRIPIDVGMKTESWAAILEDIYQNNEKIKYHGKKADAIVKNMIQHSRPGSGKKEPTDINALCEEYLTLAYHGMRAKDKSFNAKIETSFDSSLGKVNVVPQEIGRALINLLNNAFYAVNEKRKPGSAPGGYEPLVSVRTVKTGNRIEIQVEDNADGIPHKIVDKIFQPFFTTKPTGQGTGLGLSMAYDSIKAHGGELKVKTNKGEGSVFSILL